MPLVVKTTAEEQNHWNATLNLHEIWKKNQMI